MTDAEILDAYHRHRNGKLSREMFLEVIQQEPLDRVSRLVAKDEAKTDLRFSLRLMAEIALILLCIALAVKLFF